MTWLALALFVLTAVVGGLICYRMEVTANRMVAAVKDSHADCVLMATSAISTAHATHVLRAAAERYDSVAEKKHIDRVVRNKRDDPRSVPALWMLDLADRMENKDA